MCKLTDFETERTGITRDWGEGNEQSLLNEDRVVSFCFGYAAWLVGSRFLDPGSCLLHRKLRVLTTREFPGTEFQFEMMKKFRSWMMVMVE